MAEKKRYWLKLEKNFLKSPQMKVIKAMPNGKDYILFYLSLLLESIETIGHLRFTELVPYSEDMLAAVTDTNIDIVRTAVKVFCQLGLMEMFDDGTIFMTQVASMTGKESESAERVRLFRDKQKQLPLHCNTDVTKCNDNKEKQSIKTDNNKQDTENRKAFYDIIINYLNDKCSTSYKATTKSTQKHINARLDEGFEVDDFFKVIDVKANDWLNDAKMKQYLRPETLFASKFESYLNQAKLSLPNVEEEKINSVPQKSNYEGRGY